MVRLLRYTAVIYDSNCVILYCFHHEVPRRDGPPLVIQENATLTPLIRLITERLLESERRVYTLQAAIDEISDPLLAGIVTQRISNDEVRVTLGLRRGTPFPAELKLQILDKCKKTLKKLKARDWFLIEPRRPSGELVEQLMNFFRAVERDAALRGRLNPGKSPIPSRVDVELMAYSREAALPILTNDSNFTAFTEELRGAGLVTEIVPLTSVSGLTPSS